MKTGIKFNILPMCLNDMIAPDNEVRAIDAIVDKMDIHSMGFIYSETKDTGRSSIYYYLTAAMIKKEILME